MHLEYNSFILNTTRTFIILILNYNMITDPAKTFPSANIPAVEMEALQNKNPRSEMKFESKEEMIHLPEN